MKGLSILFSISLFVFAGILAEILKRSGVLPSQLSLRQSPASDQQFPLKFVSFQDNNPHHFN